MKRLTNLLGLIKRKPKVGQTPSSVVWTENKWSLLRYRQRPEGLAFQTPILLVPSLINRHYVLDLMPGKSLAEYLVAQGHDVFCIDWGTPGDEDRYLSFDDIVDRYIGRALSQTLRHSGQSKAHVLGYCMGGTLAAIHTAAHPQRVASLVALAAPVSFADGGLLGNWTRSNALDVGALLSAYGNAPWQLIASAFSLLRPTLPLAKAVMVLDRAENDEFLEGFQALEAWGNDNVAIPGEFYRRYLNDLYRRDELVNGTLTLSGRRVNLKDITCPTMVVTFEHDNIVPTRSASPLLELISSQDKQPLHLPGGHVGAVVSKHAAKTLWPQLSGFWARHEQGSARSAIVTTRAPAGSEAVSSPHPPPSAKASPSSDPSPSAKASSKAPMKSTTQPSSPSSVSEKTTSSLNSAPPVIAGKSPTNGSALLSESGKGGSPIGKSQPGSKSR